MDGNRKISKIGKGKVGRHICIQKMGRQEDKLIKRKRGQEDWRKMSRYGGKERVDV